MGEVYNTSPILHWSGMPIYVLSDESDSGIVSTSSAVSVDPDDVVSGSFQAVVGDGVSTNIVVTHNGGTRDMSVEVYRNSDPFDVVRVDVEMTTTNTVTLRFASAPSTNEYRVLIRPTE